MLHSATRASRCQEFRKITFGANSRLTRPLSHGRPEIKYPIGDWHPVVRTLAKPSQAAPDSHGFER